MIVVISAPSGAGKTTICRRLLERFPEMSFSVSYTTRKPREGEVEKGEYIFVSKEEFERMIEKDEFVEWVKIFGDYYGTPKSELKGDILLDIDVEGAKIIKRLYPDAITIFLLPPSISELENRLRRRKTESEEKLAKRLKRAEREMAEAKSYDHCIVNEDIDTTVFEIMNIIREHQKAELRMAERREKYAV
jgi:guanylate kinase